MTTDHGFMTSYIKTKYLDPARPVEVIRAPSCNCRVKMPPAMMYHIVDDDITCESLAARGNVNASNRLTDLAKPKKCHCRSEVVCDELSSPVRQVCRAALSAVATPRTVEISQPRPLHKDFIPDCPKMHVYSIGRPNETYKVSEAAKSTDPSSWPRAQDLAVSHRPTERVVHERPAETEISPAALKARASARLKKLAEPRESSLPKQPPYAIGGPSVITLIPREALEFKTTERLQLLAEYVPLPEDYTVERSPEWPVSKAAQEYWPTDRIKLLARSAARIYKPRESDALAALRG